MKGRRALAHLGVYGGTPGEARCQTIAFREPTALTHKTATLATAPLDNSECDSFRIEKTTNFENMVQCMQRTLEGSAHQFSEVTQFNAE